MAVLTNDIFFHGTEAKLNQSLDMARSLPLNALNAFEVAARHESFSKAADELNVTPAAVSQQIRMLEELMGVQLFTT